MDKKNIKLLVLFSLVQCVFVFLHIEQSSTYLRLLYLKQRNEKIRAECEDEKNVRTRDFERLKNPDAVKAYVLARGMVPMQLKQLKKISDLNDLVLQNKN